jgi:hypothetical protein
MIMGYAISAERTRTEVRCEEQQAAVRDGGESRTEGKRDENHKR